ncbi:MAG: Rha family transcriptional regulator [Desulforhopalus sp.]
MNNQLVIINEQEVPVTTSKKVAEYFGKQHGHVLESIRMIMGITANKTQEGISDFRETTFKNLQNHQEYPMFEMTRKGFMLLVMGFTGERAMRFKRDFIKVIEKDERKTGVRGASFRTEYVLTIDAAKHVAIVSNTEKGFEV